MRKIVFAALAALLLCGQSPVMNGFPPGAFQSRAAIDATPAASYTGPGDIVSGSIGWWGLRGYNGAYSGNVATICDSATGLICANITWGGGALNIPTIGGVACNNTTNVCVIGTLFDQSGAGNNMVQATNSARPVFVTSCIGTLPCMTFSSSQTIGSTTGTGSTTAQVWSMSGVVYSQSTGTTAIILGDNSVAGSFGISVIANRLYFNNGSGGQSLTGIPNNAWYAAQFVNSAVASIGYINGTSHSLTGSAGSLVGSSGYSTNSPSISQGTLQLVESGVWPSTFTTGNQTSMNSNQHTYWGF